MDADSIRHFGRYSASDTDIETCSDAVLWVHEGRRAATDGCNGRQGGGTCRGAAGGGGLLHQGGMERRARRWDWCGGGGGGGAGECGGACGLRFLRQSSSSRRKITAGTAATLAAEQYDRAAEY